MAAILALQELLGILIGECAYSDNQDVFKHRLRTIEERAVNSLQSRRLWDATTDESDALVKELASAQVTKIMTAIRHHKEPGGATDTK
jgi:hypothetical protein